MPVTPAPLHWRMDNRLKVSLTAVSTAAQYWQDSDAPIGSGNTFVPAKIPAYAVMDLSSEWQVNRDMTLLTGISSLGDRHYYDRVWQTRLEPAFGRSVYAGVKLGI